MATVGRTLVAVTGHTRGLGAALVRSSRLAGAETIGVGRTRTGAADHEIVADLSQDEGIAEAARSLESIDFSGYDVACLVNNAAVIEPIRRVGALDLEAVLRAVTVNLTAVIALSNALLAATDDEVVERRVLNISSGAASKSYVGWSVYCAAKAGLDHFTATLAVEAPSRCRVVALAPGVIDTGMQAEIRNSDPAQFPDRPRFEAMKSGGALAEAEDVASRIVAFLLGESFGRQPVASIDQLR